MIPVVSYARISVDGRKDEHGVQDQHAVNRETAARHGWTVVHEFTDNDKSAAKAHVVRDAFEAMVRALRAGRLDDGTPVQGAVVVADDRLARRPGDYERFVEAFTKRDGLVFADSKQTKNLYSEDTESMGLFGVVISKMEVRKMQRRMRRSHRARAESGTPVGGARPFGWQDDRVTLDPVEAPLVRQAARDFIAGRSLHSIAREWQRNGLKTPRGNKWQSVTLKAVLSAPRLCGWRRLDGEIVRDGEGKAVVGKWEPILTPEEWLAVQAIIDTRKGGLVHNDGSVVRLVSSQERERQYLLSGILRCGRPTSEGGICNKPLRAMRRQGIEYHSYSCSSKAAGGCGGISRRGDVVDFFISELVMTKMEEVTFSESADDSEWAGEEELETAVQQLDELTRRWRTKEISGELYFRVAPELEATMARLRADRAKRTASAEVRQARASLSMEEIRRRWYLSEEEGGLPLSSKRAHITDALHAVIVHPRGGGRAPFNPDLLEPVWRE
ncbi:recombinase family protein [Streptosporangium sp. 'caverna']|uniref:recombinase family protein n=1 Tax=Streptosporangium sp. 'caverna' TaxID=2202249 RepID=UPI000D7E1E7F|nr:recombinase family protein [Streptosporangium sp. 'caverna']AWS44099.1 recombinase family protein [Streptosporangium sp. 'caverna']